MDLETENRIASILLKEAAELRREAQKEGALAYLREPTVRSRPNSRFLTATVRGVQQANRVVEVNEMWRLREKQIELDNRIRESRFRRRDTTLESCRNRMNRSHEIDATTAQNEFRRIEEGNEGLRDDEVEEFLQSRIKRGRGTVGSRMDETGPYLPSNLDAETIISEIPEDDNNHLRKHRIVLGPSKPSSDGEMKRKRRKKDSEKHQCSKKHESNQKSGNKNDLKRKENRSKHR